MQSALLAMLLKTVREIERQKPGTIDLLRNALDVLEAERESRMKAESLGGGGSGETASADCADHAD